MGPTSWDSQSGVNPSRASGFPPLVNPPRWHHEQMAAENVTRISENQGNANICDIRNSYKNTEHKKDMIRITTRNAFQSCHGALACLGS